MTISITVENIRCSGCANTITKKLMAIDSVTSVDIDIDEQRVTIQTDDPSARPTYIKMLLTLGYPEQGSVEGITALKGKAKSVISCAVGKVT